MLIGLCEIAWEDPQQSGLSPDWFAKPDMCRFSFRGGFHVKTLIAAGADVNARDSNGDTALSIAVRIGRTGIAKLLTERVL
jgi:ankyrin repeat protein